jgi:hypothetical protein
MVTSSTPNRAVDDDAPIVAADVVAARRLLRGMGLIKRVLLAAIAAFALLVVVPLMHSSWQRHQHFTWCMEGVAKQHDRYVRGDIPRDAVVHHGHHGTVIDAPNPNTLALMVNGQVAASTLRCGREW